MFLFLSSFQTSSFTGLGRKVRCIVSVKCWVIFHGVLSTCFNPLFLICHISTCMKEPIYYSLSIPVSLGFLVFLRSGWCLIDSVRVMGNPLTPEFWYYFIKSFQSFSLFFRIFGWVVFLVVLILLQNNRVKKSLTQETE